MPARILVVVRVVLLVARFRAVRKREQYQRSTENFHDDNYRLWLTQLAPNAVRRSRTGVRLARVSTMGKLVMECYTDYASRLRSGMRIPPC